MSFTPEQTLGAAEWVRRVVLAQTLLEQAVEDVDAAVKVRPLRLSDRDHIRRHLAAVDALHHPFYDDIIRPSVDEEPRWRETISGSGVHFIGRGAERRL